MNYAVEDRKARSIAILEELREAETMAELQALWCHGQREASEYADASYVPSFKEAVRRLRPLNRVHTAPSTSAADKIAQMEQMLAELKSLQALQQSAAPKVQRSFNRYRLLSTEVKWTTKPQVHAIVAILAAHMQVGDVVDEADIVRMMVNNEVVLDTRQGGEKVWKYYKGKHDLGLEAHGNIEEVR
jgi:uncharacterized protein YkuJ